MDDLGLLDFGKDKYRYICVFGLVMGRVAKSRVWVGSGFEIYFRVRVGLGFTKKFSGLVRVCQK